MRPQQIALLVSLLASLPAGLVLPLSITSNPTPVAQAQILESHETEADRLFHQGEQQFHQNQYREAIESWQQALAIYRADSNHNAEANVLANLGAAYTSLSQHQKAIEYYQQALPIYQQIRDRNEEANILLGLGSAYYLLSQYLKAKEYYQQALPIFQQVRDRNEEANILLGLGNVYNSLSQYQKAVEYYQQALPIFQQVRDRNGEAQALLNLGGPYFSFSQYEKANEYSQQALPIFQQVRDRNGEAQALANLGTAYNSLSQYQKAVEYYQQALPIHQQVRDRNGEATALMNLGNAYAFLSQYERAKEYYQQALPIFQQIGNRNGEAMSLANLGNTYDSLSQYEKAKEYYQQALPIFQQIGNRNGEDGALMSLGNAYDSLSQYEKAKEYYRQALPVFQQVRDRNGEAQALLNLGGAYDSLSQYEKAKEYYRQALPVFQQVRDRKGEAQALLLFGNAYAFLSQYEKAKECYQQALLIFQQIDDRSGEGTTLNNLGSTLFATGSITAAEKTLVAAIKIWESLRSELVDEHKVSIFEGQARSYRTLQEVLIAQNKVEAALEIAERGRARAFVELLSQRLGSQQPASQIQEVIQAPDIQQIRQIAKAQNATLVQYSIIYDDFQIQGKQTSRESALYIWVIQPTGEITFRQVDLKPLWQQHNASLISFIINHQESESLRSRSRSSGRSTKSEPNFNLQRLHQQLIDPIANLLPKNPNAHVIFIPQGSLFQVPFPALQDANGTYLIQKHTILTAPSIQVLALTRQQQQKLANELANRHGNALVLGNPTMPQVSLSPGEPKQTLSPLPEAETEAIAVARMLNTQAIIGPQGTKAAITQKMPQASIIHLATHGLLDNVQGLGSAIALAPSGNDDGLLTAAEILDMKLQASLVVLSACNTGEGRITGDGVIGLSRSLIAAGVPSVIVSLWAVPDAPTAELMQTFYKNLQNNPNKAQALRQAMLTTMKNHPQPRNWAAFTLIGEAE
ncbi:CHAT domain-containing tetratricopeptide repeat protein [Trichocoleus sp. FACHB-262]|uniref:CHAT domain-containing tetratricopeptide repeat protein n=1 Tax=Trichocoleus sp. FACHB-262 TaxID=2692869 RepID=UPI001685A6FC|nr:CHAT domain-containing tetratricopeptide repeat protein [Trichocoleus sp. FACHB-262]MBD2121526.1 tetratricopeptide repeat protein [Trichocoleus sp. FACHB-262]